jgi:hypothetical protein
MPAKSKAQLRLAYAVLEGKSKAMPKSVAREIAEATKSTKRLPSRKTRKS